MSERGLVLLGYRVRTRVILRYWGYLSLSLAVMAAVPMCVGFAFSDHTFALWALGAFAGLLAFGLICSRISAPREMQVNEGLVVVALTFLLGAAVMSLPLAAAGLPLIDAFFESGSGLTTTGLSTLGSIEKQSAAFVFARAWLQWYGGLAIVVLALALVLGPSNVTRRLAGDTDHEEIVSGTQARARQLLSLYAGLTVVAILGIWLLGAPFFQAVVHGLSAISTGGFSSYDDSIVGFGGWPLRIGITAVCLFGAVSFSLQYRALRAGWRAIAADRELHTLLIACLVTATALSASMALAGRWSLGEIILNAPIMAVSA